jgi:hypothetical protein
MPSAIHRGDFVTGPETRKSVLSPCRVHATKAPKTCLGVRLNALLPNASAFGQSSFLPSPRRSMAPNFSRAECSTVPARWACLTPLFNSWVIVTVALAGVRVPQTLWLFCDVSPFPTMHCRPCPYLVKYTIQGIQQSAHHGRVTFW